ncbi:hypothetical protein HPB49_011627 [Dermacentor silvarum]|uniref:Uncharacterized protein n=1 Tax=Dermacentor silvarum TaxID=543639 RepID=A0ACB8C3G9_DERSI|nr:hypothetical protein HPB49_011627 [Dermacentor silvarum]
MVDLADELESPLQLDLPPEPSVHGRWLVVEGVSLEPDPDKPTPAVQETDGSKGVHTDVNASHMQYYEEITKALLGSDKQLVDVALEDLASNPCLSPLLPYLVHFVSLGVRKLSHDLASLDRLLHAIDALAQNASLNLDTLPYVSLTLLFCLLEPLAAAINPANDHWALRDNAAQLLAALLRFWADRVAGLENQVLDALGECVRDPSLRPLCAQYGAVSGLTALGVEALQQVLGPHLVAYWRHLEAVLADCRPANAQAQADATRVHGALLLAAEKLVKEQRREMARSESPGASYDLLYDCFGDALASRLPLLYGVAQLLYTPRQAPLKAGGRGSPTGEQLLEAFYEEERSPSAAEEDNNSEESNLSGPSPNIHPQVKSTISDPARGIRLTIALRRPPSESKQPRKKRPPGASPHREPPFEGVPWTPVPRRAAINICFEGATPVVRPTPEPPTPVEGEWRTSQLSRRMGRVGRGARRRRAYRDRHTGAGIDAIL